MTTFANLERHTPDRIRVLPVRHGDRPTGAYLVHGETVTMGPGGWISLKGAGQTVELDNRRPVGERADVVAQLLAAS